MCPERAPVRWTAQNSSFRQVGTKSLRHFARTLSDALKWGIKDGYWESLKKPMMPRSTYVQQLKDRLGETVLKNLEL